MPSCSSYGWPPDVQPSPARAVLARPPTSSCRPPCSRPWHSVLGGGTQAAVTPPTGSDDELLLLVSPVTFRLLVKVVVASILLLRLYGCCTVVVGDAEGCQLRRQLSFCDRFAKYGLHVLCNMVFVILNGHCSVKRLHPGI